MSQTTFVVNSTTPDNVISIKVTWGGGQPAIITTPFSTSPRPLCDVCGREYKLGEGGWISVYQGGGKVENYHLCPECLKEIRGMINMLIQVLKGGKKR